MKMIILEIGNKKLRDGTIFRIGTKKYKMTFSEAGFDYNIDLWDFEAEKPLSIIGTIKKNGTATYGNLLLHIDEILEF